MKKCPKCRKIYDDSWGVCLHCTEKLHEIQLTKEEMEEMERIKLAKAEKERYQMEGPISVILGIFLSIFGMFSWFVESRNTFNVTVGLGLGTSLILGGIFYMRNKRNKRVVK
jgi:hypothetical protein